jgi:hypothetical protein
MRFSATLPRNGQDGRICRREASGNGHNHDDSC